MSINPIAKLKLSPQKEQALRDWMEARERYRAESKLFQRVRKNLPKHLEDCNNTQIVLLHTAKTRYSAACKEYYEAQQLYNSSNSPLSGPLETQDQVAAAVEQLINAIKGTPTAAVRDTAEELEKQALHERFGSIEQSPVLSAIAQVARERRQAQLAAETQSLLETTDEIEDFSSPEDSPSGNATASSEAGVDSPEDLIRKYGIPE